MDNSTAILKEMDEDPECHEFVSEEETLKELGIELEALRAGREDRAVNGTIPHEAINWD